MENTFCNLSAIILRAFHSFARVIVSLFTTLTLFAQRYTPRHATLCIGPLRCTGNRCICITDAQAVDDSTIFWEQSGNDEASNGDVPDLPPVPTDAAAVGSTSLHNLRVAQSTVVDEARTNSDKTVEQALAIEGELI